MTRFAIPCSWSSALRWRLLLGVMASFFVAAPAHAGNGFEIGAGWQDTGAVEGALEWKASIQGSRKDVPAWIGWRHVGERRFYWAPYARLNYVNFWSIAGGGNALGVTAAPGGIGVYMSRPPSDFAPAARPGRWFATLEVNFASFTMGGNVTPNSPSDPRIPDPEAHRAALRADIQKYGGVQPGTMITQFYPFGSYSYATLSIPIQIRAWKMVTERLGFGFFIEGYPLMLEWNLNSGGGSTPAYGYDVSAGLSAVVF